MYHRFCERDEDRRDAVDADTFRWQLQQLSKGWHVLTLREYVTRNREGESLPPYVAIITVDDGYRDFYDIAYPLLKEYGMRATFFPTTSFVNGEWMWWDKLRFIFRETRKDRLIFNSNGDRRTFTLSTADHRRHAYMELANIVERLDGKEQADLISVIGNDLGVCPPDEPPGEFRAVTWDELAEMARNGIEVGSHTSGHPLLTRLAQDELAHELSSSKRMIEEKIGRPVVSLCYPYGRRTDINELVCRVAKNAGYHGAVVSYMDTGRFDAYKISRMAVGRDRVDFLWKLYGIESLVTSFRKRHRR